MLLIGSRALAIRYPQALTRKPKDFDYVSTEDEAMDFVKRHDGQVTHRDGPDKLFANCGGTMIEFDIIQPGSTSEELVDMAKSDALDTSFGRVPNLDALFTLKTSHRHKKNSPHFWKNLADWHRMRLMGAKVRDEWRPWLKRREAETYNYAHPSLMRPKKDFFSEADGIFYTYDHDSIHEAVALYDKPAYRSFALDDHEVMSSREKFEACSREIQIASVLEESAVLAIERSLVPHPGVLTPEQAWRLAFSKVCTSIASGWWRAWAYENALDILPAYPSDYVERFQRGLANGVVKKV